ncbi:MAG: nicotinate (nicotinamide) nucleotide adenylyltransferase [Anaerolineales bacterium]|nr:nicotinate (nicotinamide) nucleotide adenylyltransferase [Anaerolineae bacterium]PWB50870.1 MAG: nicotinate (nicotinamide) nucleotide adenylyltransferase [Anaerolineales bacterium]
MRVGVFGGTFDPPHIGHQILAEEAAAQLNLDQVLWVLTPYPPHKTTLRITHTDDRMSMVLLAIAGNAKFSLSRVDIDRPPPHYAADTVQLLREKSPRDEFIYLMGADSLNDLPTWHEPKRFTSLCQGLGVMGRPGEGSDLSTVVIEIPGIREKITFLDTPLIEISGTDIRNRVALGKPVRYFLPENIFHYILNHKLYYPQDKPSK